eukprot:6885056-Pyramimonas_sp.AAC.1
MARSALGNRFDQAKKRTNPNLAKGYSKSKDKGAFKADWAEAEYSKLVKKDRCKAETYSEGQSRRGRP